MEVTVKTGGIEIACAYAEIKRVVTPETFNEIRKAIASKEANDTLKYVSVKLLDYFAEIMHCTDEINQEDALTLTHIFDNNHLVCSFTTNSLLNIGLRLGKYHIQLNEHLSIRGISLGDDISKNANKNVAKLRIPLATKYGSIDLNSIVDSTNDVIARENEISRIMQALVSRKHGNVILVGDNGVGKTAIVEALAYRANDSKLTDKLNNMHIVSLDINTILGGCRYRGDFEERFIGILEELNKTKNCIAFIDNFASFVGKGVSDGDSSSAACDILTQFLKNHSDFHCIGCCTYTEWQHSINKSPSIKNMLTKIDISELPTEQVLKIVSKHTPLIENYYNLKLSKKQIETVVALSNRYITNKKQPVKAIEALDNACAKAVVKGVSSPKLKTSFIYDSISEIANVPVNQVRTNDKERLLTLADKLKTHVKGQDMAIDALCTAIKCNQMGLHDNKKPIGSFMFAGSTGVGKTELCKALAIELFGSEKAIIRIDMSEFLESHSISKLLGSPKGYVGYGEGGYLTDAIEKQPYSIILFDEVEKAHPDVLNILLQLMDDGRLTDSQGKTVDCTNCVIIMTTNCGAKKKGEDSHVGFISVSESNREADFKSAIKATFKPEFVNRIDDIIIFNTLSKDVIRDITRNLLDEVATLAKSQGVIVTFDDSVIDYCASNSYDEENGARPLRNFIYHNIKSYIAMSLLENKVQKGKMIIAYSETCDELYDLAYVPIDKKRVPAYCT